jgi:hypothetical protein
MDLDTAKIDEDVLALLYLTSFRERAADPSARAWKSHDWDAMDRLYQAGFISNPRSKAKSVVMTEEGYRRAEELFRRKYGKEG